jgi:hypothetical protein
MMDLSIPTKRRILMVSRTSNMDTLEYIQQKFGLNMNQRNPIEIPNFDRNQLTGLFSELGYKTIVEVGVCSGVYSDTLCRANPQATIYGVDPFIPHKEYKDYQLQRTISAYHEDAKKLLDKYPNYRLIEDYSVEAAKQFEDGSVDAVYLDGNHRLEYVIQDIQVWLPKLRKGGIISGHDYAKIRTPTNTHVYQAVNAYTDSYAISPWFLIGQNARIPGEARDRLRSWMFIK